MAITIKDIAKMANTSIATVSNVLSNKPGVGKAKKKLVLEIVKETGYRPHRSARNLVMQKSGTIGFIVSDLINNVYVDIFRKFESYFRREGYQVFLADSKMDAKKERVNIDMMLDNRVEALVIAPVHEFKVKDDTSHFSSLRTYKVPFVILGRLDDPQLDYVTSEEVQSARELTQHLIDLGHREIAFIGYDPDNRAAMERYQGVKQAVKGAQRATLKYRHCETGADSQVWAGKVDSLLESPERPSAIVMVNDITAINAIQRCKAAGLKVPEDISVVGFGDSPSTTIIEPALTTVSENIDDLADATTRLLNQKLKDPELPSEQILISQHLILRESAGPPPRKAGSSRR